jgi:cold shock CspA family protein
MASAILVDWLPSVQGLGPEAQTQARQLFEKHHIDKAFLDFIVSDSGALIIEAHRRGVEADLQAEVQFAADPQRNSAGRLCGRQKIGGEVRQSELHYFKRHHTPDDSRVPQAPVSSTKSSSSTEARRQSGEGNGKAATTPVHPAPSRAQGTSLPKPCGDALSAEGAALRSPARSTSMGSAASSPSPGILQPMIDGIEVEGTLKSFNEATGYGFISSLQVAGTDIFLNSSQLPGGVCREPGQRLRCKLGYDTKGRPQARDVEWLEANDAHISSEAAEIRLIGTLKSMGDTYGFIECDDTKRQFNRDVYVNRSQLYSGWQLQQPISFVITTNAQGQPQAKNVLPAMASQPEHGANGLQFAAESHLHTSTRW